MKARTLRRAAAAAAATLLLLSLGGCYVIPCCAGPGYGYHGGWGWHPHDDDR